MNWDVAGALSEVIGAIAVVITLIYLARQINQGAVAQNKDTYRSFVTELNQVLFAPMSDRDMTSLLQNAAKGFESLNSVDQGGRELDLVVTSHAYERSSHSTPKRCCGSRLGVPT